MINLLPPRQKKLLVLERKKRLIVILGIVGLVFFVSLILVLLSVEFYVAGQIEAQKIILEQKQKEFQSSEIKTFREEIRLANQSFLKLRSFYQEQVSLVEILEKINQTLPLRAYLNSFSYDNTKINLKGYAPTRSILLEFRENLVNEKEFKNIEFPGEPWIKSVDIEFSATFQINKKD